MAGDLLAAIAAPLNRRILAALAVEPSYARRIAALIGAAEAEVSRRLRALERLGLLSSTWQREASNVKIYALRTASLQVDLTPAGIEVRSRGSGRRLASAEVALMPLPPADGFVGRVDVLASLAAARPVVIVEGLPGVGKTHLLAKHVEGSDALWFTCRGNETLGWVANQAATQLAARGDAELRNRLRPDTPGPELHALLLERLQRPGTTTVFDDVHLIVDPALRSFVSDAVACMQKGRLLIASRERVAHAPRPGIHVIELEGLADEDAALLLRNAGIDVPEGLAGRLHDEVGGHPLALSLLAEAARSEGLEGLLDRRPERELTHYLLEEIDGRLSLTERTALSHASVFPHVFGAEDLHALGSRNAEITLAALRRRRLMAADERGYRLPEVVRNFFYDRLQDRARLHRLAAARRLEQGDLTGHLEAMHHLITAGDRDEVITMLSHDLDVHAYEHIDTGYHRMYAQILDLFSREEVGDAAWAQILDERGDLAFHAGQWDIAAGHYAEAQRLFAVHGPERCPDALWKQALCMHRAGRAQDAARLCEEALRDAMGATRHRLQALQEELGQLTA